MVQTELRRIMQAKARELHQGLNNACPMAGGDSGPMQVFTASSGWMDVEFLPMSLN